MPAISSTRSNGAALWIGAWLQEREVYDLMGVYFEGHPSLTRLFLWDTFPGHPLRKDFMSLPGGHISLIAGRQAVL